MPILYVDTDGVTLGDEEHVYSPDVHAVLAFRAPDSSIKKPLFEQLLNRSESGQAYVTITADTWKIDMPIRTKNMHQASTLVDRINELAAESDTSHG
jgi:mRNA deadenylase 3'-5' endonuclease subunit Ccr4